MNASNSSTSVPDAWSTTTIEAREITKEEKDSNPLIFIILLAVLPVSTLIIGIAIGFFINAKCRKQQQLKADRTEKEYQDSPRERQDENGENEDVMIQDSKELIMKDRPPLPPPSSHPNILDKAEVRTEVSDVARTGRRECPDSGYVDSAEIHPKKDRIESSDSVLVGRSGGQEVSYLSLGGVGLLLAQSAEKTRTAENTSGQSHQTESGDSAEASDTLHVDDRDRVKSGYPEEPPRESDVRNEVVTYKNRMNLSKKRGTSAQRAGESSMIPEEEESE